MKVLILCPYPPVSAPSQRFRFEQFLDFLSKQGIEVEQRPFLNPKGWESLYFKGHFLQKVGTMISGFLRRIMLISPGLRSYDIVFIHREATPLGPPFLEWWISKILGKPIVYDFDDAIWFPNISSQNKLAARLKWHSKVRHICRWSRRVSVGNEFLGEFAKSYSVNVHVVPTTIDTDFHFPVPDRTKEAGEPIIIGWTGSHSTLPYLEMVLEPFRILEMTIEFDFVVISNVAPDMALPNLVFQPWDSVTEISDLQDIDIGIMPLPDNDWSRGKCGLKALQYMALEIPCIASPVGVNTEIIDDGINGLLASTEEEWVEKLTMLIENPDLRKRLGKEGRRTVIEKYSVEANKRKYLTLLKDL